LRRIIEGAPEPDDVGGDDLGMARIACDDGESTEGRGERERAGHDGRARQQSSCPLHSSFSGVLCVRSPSAGACMSQAPDVRRHRGNLTARELRATHWRHRAAVIARARHAMANRAFDSLVAAVAPVPSAGSEVGTERRALALLSVAAGTRARGHLPVEDPVAERHHLARGALRDREASGRRRIGMNAFRRLRTGRLRRAAQCRHVRAGRDTAGSVGRAGAATVHDAIDPSMHVIGDVKRAAGPYGQSCRAMRRRARVFLSSGEAVSKYLALPRGRAVGEWLKHYVVALLRKRRAIPRAVEGDEYAAVVALGELLATIDRQIQGRPVGRIGRDGVELTRAEPDGLAVAAVFGREEELALNAVVVAIGPAVVAALHHVHHLLRGQVGTLLRGEEFGPVLPQLITPVLSRIDLAPGVDRDAVSIADARGIAAGR